MTFLELIGGVIVFGLLWLFMPRASFVVALGLILYYKFNIPILKDPRNIWEVLASIIILIVVVAGVIIDIWVMKEEKV